MTDFSVLCSKRVEDIKAPNDALECEQVIVLDDKPLKVFNTSAFLFTRSHRHMLQP